MGQQLLLKLISRLSHHCAASNLVLLKRLLELLEHRKMTDVDTNALTSRSERAQRVGHINIDLPRVCLAGDDVRRIEASLLSNKFIETLDLVVVTFEDLKERGLGTGSTLDTTETQVLTGPLQVPEVHQQILDPKAGSLANCHELRRLPVGETQARQVLVFLGESGQLVDHDCELGNEDIETIAEEDKVGIIGAVARSGTPVDDTGRGGGNLTVGVNVGHDIVSPALFLLSSNCKLVILNDEVSLHLLNGLIGNVETNLCS